MVGEKMALKLQKKVHTKGLMKMIRGKDKEYFIGYMEVNTRDLLLKTKCMVMENFMTLKEILSAGIHSKMVF